MGDRDHTVKVANRGQAGSYRSGKPVSQGRALLFRDVRPTLPVEAAHRHGAAPARAQPETPVPQHETARFKGRRAGHRPGLAADQDALRPRQNTTSAKSAPGLKFIAAQGLMKTPQTVAARPIGAAADT